MSFLLVQGIASRECAGAMLAGDSNNNTKRLFKNRLKVRLDPSTLTVLLAIVLCECSTWHAVIASCMPVGVMYMHERRTAGQLSRHGVQGVTCSPLVCR